MSKTNFEKVFDFNRQFDVLKEDVLVPKTDIISKDPAQVEFCLKLIREEVRELEDAVKTNDYVEMVDALGDILYVVYGMGARVGMDMDKAFALIHENNMSKLCVSEDEASRSVAHYNELDAALYNAAYRRAANGRDWVVYNQNTMKVLKRIGYVPVDLTPLINGQ